jgi:hypothetical protein
MMINESLKKHPAYRYSSNALVATLGSDPRDGLTTMEAHARLQRYGQNVLPSAPPPPLAPLPCSIC